MQTLNFYTNTNLINLSVQTYLHKIHNKNFNYPYTDKKTKKSGFWLVKDDGIYLINAFKLGKNETPTSMNYTSYANGYNPNCYDSDELWERTYQFSRDDFAEFIEVSERQLIALRNRCSLQINFYDDFYETIILTPTLKSVQEVKKEIQLEKDKLQNA